MLDCAEVEKNQLSGVGVRGGGRFEAEPRKMAQQAKWEKSPNWGMALLPGHDCKDGQ